MFAHHSKSPLNVWVLLLSLSLVLMLAAMLSLLGGSEHSGWASLQRLFSGELDALEARILLDLRLPRVGLAILVGATLAVSGAAMQGLFRNPLADPGLLGISAGCALGAALVIVLTASGLGTGLTMLGVPAGAFIGGLLTTWLVYRLGRSTAAQGRGMDVATLLLAGVAINAIAGAATSGLKYLAGDQALRSVVFWLMGDLGNVGGATLIWAAPLLFGVMALITWHARVLNALLLGEAEAQHLGFSVERNKRVLIVLIALGVGVSVALAGVIGFIGLVVPHLIRLVMGADHRFLLPASMLAGASLLLVADWLARTLIAPAVMPVGILTALIGGPFFLYLLQRQRWYRAE